MKLIIISGDTDATAQFSRMLKDRSAGPVLVSSDIDVLIHQRRSANPPQYAVADVSNLSLGERAAISRLFPGARRSHILPDTIPISDLLHLVNKSL